MVLFPKQNARRGRRFTASRWLLVAVATTPGIFFSGPVTQSTIAASATVSGGEASCAETQRVPVDAEKPWRCTAQFDAQKSYLVRIDRQDVDVILELVAPSGARELTVDSPTQRAGAELLFYRTTARGRYTIVVSTAERGAPATQVGMQLLELSGARAGTRLARGLSTLTTAASVTTERDSAHELRRVGMLRDAQADLAAAGERELEADVRLRIASAYYWIVNDWSSAAAAAQEAMRAYDLVPSRAMSARAAVLRGAALIELTGSARPTGAARAPKSGRGQYDEVEQLLVMAASQFHALGLKYDEAQALNHLGVAFDHQARYEEARSRCAAALRLLDEAGERSAALLPLRNMAAIDHEIGNYAEAIDSYEQLIARTGPQEDRRAYLALLNNMGSALNGLGDHQRALTVLMTALRVTEGTNDLGDRARTFHALGRTYLTIGDDERAAIFLEQALALRRSGTLQDRRGLYHSLLYNGELQRARGNLAQALQLHLAALDHAVSPEEKARVLIAVGRDQIAGGQFAAGIQAYERALKLDLPEDWPARVSVLGAYGEALLSQGNPSGRTLLQKAAQSHERAGDHELAAQDYYLLASADHRAGKVDEALTNVRKALTMYETQRIRAVNPDLRATYVANRAAAYELQAELFMSLRERSENPGERNRLGSSALAAAEALRARALEDFRQFAQASPTSGAASAELYALDSRLAAKRNRLATELDAFSPSAERMAALRGEIAMLRTELDVAQRKVAGSPSTARLSTFSLPQLQRTLADDAVLVTWLLGDTRSWIWCITRTQASAFPLKPGREVERGARDLHAHWSRPPGAAGSRESELAASGIILGTASAAFSGRRSAIVVADGALRAVPFGALWLQGGNKSQAQRIAESLVVAYRPTLTQLEGMPTSVRAAGPNDRILLVGDPVIISAPRVSESVGELRPTPAGAESMELPRLPGSRREIENIVGIADGWQSVVLVGNDATKSAVLASPLDTFRVLHFATHARLDVRDPQLSSILLSGPPAEVGTGSAALSLREIVAWPLHAELVVLSACESSLGKQYRGQLSFGLSEAFLLAGANNVLGGLWRMSDAATERYMQMFYDRYARLGMPPAMAARATARALMQDPEYGHPFYWAAFVVLTA